MYASNKKTNYNNEYEIPINILYIILNKLKCNFCFLFYSIYNFSYFILK